MKKILLYSAYVFIVIITGCSQRILRDQDENYIPPSVKTQPKHFYPVTAQEKSYSGVAEVVLMISNKGKVEQVKVVKSTGYELLDKAASEYCMEIIFNPAYKNGMPIPSRVIWSVNYNFADQKWNCISYVTSIGDLYFRTNYALRDEKKIIEQKVLEKHTEFINKMTDAINFNEVIGKVIQPELLQEWKDEWNSWPLSFLLYHDFLTRFSDFDSVTKVKDMLRDAINFDIRYINKQSTGDSKIEKAKSDILKRIKEFRNRYYPEIIIDEAEI
jgi:TonB family protein